ncbi:hypothetical protein HZY83_00435 [Gemella sp. GH3]|uniref:diacylglycerol/lipid kinase family protein n=1 Tax=unclassified Gemella TaxID=2624949 RepID=UPI0015CFD2FB|nr:MULTISPECIES: diacylglycerol kinase family protein [unclassified Gemella]MBF0713177.1 hypothetical protein [Gemella sp. GH3.1]NYS50129.1 hypothetical protein [Gemella sp. GH3]
MKNITIVTHLYAGGNKGKGVLSKLQSACNKNNINYKIYISNYSGHTKLLIKEASKSIKDINSERIVVVGGDGTLNEAITGLKEENLNIPISYFPAGTGNDFARSLNLEINEEKFIEKLFNSQEENVELIKAKDNNEIYYALNGLGIGFDALISNLVNISKKDRASKLGRLSYLSKLLSAYKNRKLFSVDIIVDNVIKLKFNDVLFSAFMKNQYFGGGIKINPQAKENNNEIALIIAQNVNLIDVARILPHILFTEKHFKKTKKLQRVVGEKFIFNIKTKNLLQFDGETRKVNNINLEISITNHIFYLVRR